LGHRHGYFDTEADARAFYDECCYMLASQMAAPNSPQWFNTGLHWAYGIDGPPQGHWYCDPKTGAARQSESAYERPQPHACFIQSVADDLVSEGGIMDLWVREARLFKYGSGTGSNFSALRGEGEPLSGGGRSSGLMSFLKIGDRAAGAIKSGGTTRRAAKMVVLDVDHPDIREFINWKVQEEQKVASLVLGARLNNKHLNAIIGAVAAGKKRGLNGQSTQPKVNRDLADAVRGGAGGRDPRELHPARDPARRAGLHRHPLLRVRHRLGLGEAYYTVSGQNSNNSVRLSNAFMEAVDAGGDWALIRAPTGKVAKTLSARELWDEITYAAWAAPTRACSSTRPSTTGTPAPKTAASTQQPVLRVHVPRRHGLQPRVAQPDALPTTRRHLRRRKLPRHATRLWTIVLEISVLMAQFPSAPSPKLSATSSARSASATPTSARC
jgi:ribonucleoside-diphosphate reductase alpha chain